MIEGETKLRRTRRMRLTSGWADVKSRVFPSITHSDSTMYNGNTLGEMPKIWRALGWDTRLQITLSWNKRCPEPLKARHVKRKIFVCEPS